MTEANAGRKERVVALFYNFDDDLFLVEHAVDDGGVFRLWGFPSVERRRDITDDTLETPLAAIRRIARERFDYAMDDANLARCNHVLDTLETAYQNILYEPFIVPVDDRTKLVPQPGVVAEWRTFAALVGFAERKLFPEAHVVFLNAANEYIAEHTTDVDGDEDPGDLGEDS
ncbi:MAG: hypothetical protein RL681_256 [Candidatus Parcubacteria bacterium]|jgi:hypothetical protein